MSDTKKYTWNGAKPFRKADGSLVLKGQGVELTDAQAKAYADLLGSDEKPAAKPEAPAPKKSAKKNTDEYPKAVANKAGYFELSDGSQVKGEDEALDAQAELNGRG